MTPPVTPSVMSVILPVTSVIPPVTSVRLSVMSVAPAVSYVIPPVVEPTVTSVAPPTRAEVHRRARTSTLKSVNTIQFKEGDFVTVAIPKADRTTCELKRLPFQVIEVCGNVSLTYRLASAYGALKGKYRSVDLQP